MPDISFLTYDPNTGLIAKTKAEVLNSLLEITKQAYGGSYEVDEGTEMYNFLDILASAITDAGNACQDVYAAFSFITAQGAPLDSLVSLGGISRREGESDAQLRARYYRLLYTQSSGTVEGLEAKLLNMQTDVNRDNTSGTKEPFIEDVKVYENYTGTALTESEAMPIAWTPKGAYTVEGHSILVIIKFTDWFDEQFVFMTPSTDPENGNIQVILGRSEPGELVDEEAKIEQLVDNINDTILNYKSLGCGITVNNTREGESQQYYFAIAMDANFSITINLWFPDPTNATTYGPAVQNYVKLAVQQYINNLKLGEDVQYSGIMSAIYQAYDSLGVNDYMFSVGTSSGVGANDSIIWNGSYIGNLSTPSGDSQSGQLNPSTPNITVPYTAFLHIPDEEIDTRITVVINRPA